MTVEPSYTDGPGVELEPFARFNWKTAEARDRLGELLERAAAAKHEAEWRSVFDGRTERKAAIIHVTNQNREEWLERVSRHGLSYRAIRYSRPYDGFSHRVRRADPNDPNRITYSVIAQNDDIADKMYEAESEMEGEEKHRTVGELLGFPEKDVEFFLDVWLGEGHVDPFYRVACNTPSAEMIDGDPENIRLVDPDPYTNMAFKYFGWSFITHIPRSFESEGAGEIGRARHEIMREAGYGDAADAMLQWLNAPHVWDALHGIVNVRNGFITGTAGGSSYMSKKRVEWRREHLPQMHPERILNG